MRIRNQKLPYTLLCCTTLALMSQASYAQNCAGLPQWDPAVAYSGGSQVQHSNSAFTANWWTKNNNPETHSDQYQEWRLDGQCNSGNNQPTVLLTSPLNNSTFTKNDSVVISANATDTDGSITSVEFSVAGQVIALDSSAPYEVNWLATVGSHVVSAKATDDLGASSQVTVNISVSDSQGNQSPTASLVYPTADAQIKAGDLAVLTAEANDADGSVERVDFYVDNILIGADNTAPYQHDWLAVEGIHTFKVAVTDDLNAETISSEVTLAVSNGQVGGGCQGVPNFVAGTHYQSGDEVANENHKYRCDIGGWCSSTSAWAYAPGTGLYWTDAWTDLGVCAITPDVAIVTPTDNAVVLAGSTTVIAANASDSDGSVTQVEFFADNQSIGIDTSAPYRANWVASTAGNVQLKVIATDNENNSSEATVRVAVSDEPVVVSLTSPANGGMIQLGKSLALAADASSLTGDLTSVEFMVNGLVVNTDSQAPYAASWTPGSIGDYTVTAKATDATGNIATSSAVNVRVIEANQGGRHKLIGYWHNFVNPAGCPLRLADISPKWDVIDIAFADNDRNSNGTVHFNLFSGDIHSTCPAMDPVQFKQDVATLQAQGKIIVLSLGGAEGTITLNNATDEANFVASLTDIIAEWGFDGLDIDLESGSNLMHGTQIQQRLPRALKQIETNMGGNMYLTMAPEHPYVQGGMIAYTGIWGAYIPLIDSLRDTLDLLHVQLYNNGGLPNPYTPGSLAEGSVDMMVASVRMLVEGFDLADGSRFSPLRDDQVAIGLPSGPASANSGQASTANIVSALDCLTLGTSCGTIVPSSQYVNFGGVMTWSINWDAYDGYNFSGPIGDKIATMNAN